MTQSYKEPRGSAMVNSIEAGKGVLLSMAMAVVLVLQQGGSAASAPNRQGVGKHQEPPENLLRNSGFENGDHSPDGWTAWPASGKALFYAWDNTRFHGGARSVKIEALGTALGSWRQLVEVEAGQVYTFSGQVAFEGVRAGGFCGLQVVFRNEAGEVADIVDYPSHEGTRNFALDFPAQLKVRAPANAQVAEVNLVLKGPGQAWFDDVFFGLTPVGAICGKIVCHGIPVEGAKVSIWGDLWGMTYEATTDGEGSYRIENVPVAFPRYVLLAAKTGYCTRPRGGVEVYAGTDTVVDFELRAGTEPDPLHIQFGNLSHVRFEVAPMIPAGATIPPDSSGYPEEVRPFLQPDSYIQSDHPAVVQQARQIVSNLPAHLQTNTLEVVRAVYSWIVLHIDHDGVFTGPGGLEQPYKDVTSGIWQTIGEEGWCWGRSFHEWAYLPHELLRLRSGICVEHARLASSLLRALGIPARQTSGSNEYWAQTSATEGVWVGMSTTEGRTAFRQRGDMGDSFQGLPSETRFALGPAAVLHEDWYAEKPGLWRESHPWVAQYEFSDGGYLRAKEALAALASTGDPLEGEDVPGGADYYAIDYSDVTIDLRNLETQDILDVRFPMVSEGGRATNTLDSAYWVNHPECVISTWIERVIEPPAGGTGYWFHVTCDLTRMGEDTDGDGLGDMWEGYLNTSPSARDTDGDGMEDGAECVAGSNPAEVSSLFAIRSLQRASDRPGWILSWPAVPARLYAVQVATNAPIEFVDMATNLFVEVPSLLCVTDLVHAGHAAVFYRLSVQRQQTDH